MTDTLTERISWEIHRDDGDVMEQGFTTPESAHAQLRKMYDPSEYVVVERREWVPVEPLPLYRHRNPLAALVAWVRGDSDPWWEATRD